MSTSTVEEIDTWRNTFTGFPDHIRLQWYDDMWPIIINHMKALERVHEVAAQLIEVTK